MRKIAVVMTVFSLLMVATSAPTLAESGPMASATFVVPATSGGGTEELGGTAWFDTGIVLTPGVPVTVSATGTWLSCKEKTCRTTADGIGVRQVRDCTYIAPELSAFSLIAKTGKDGAVLIGIGPTVVEGHGKLLLAINDCYFGDNVGGFEVAIAYPCQPDIDVADPSTSACPPPAQS